MIPNLNGKKNIEKIKSNELSENIYDYLKGKKSLIFKYNIKEPIEESLFHRLFLQPLLLSSAWTIGPRRPRAGSHRLAPSVPGSGSPAPVHRQSERPRQAGTGRGILGHNGNG